MQEYRRRFEGFWAWCDARGARAIPAAPELVGTYLLELAPIYRLNTLRNIATAIAFVHRLNGLASPSASLRPVWRTIVRRHGGSARTSRALALDELEALIRALPETRRGARDRALLLVAFWGGFRAAELVGLNLGVHTPGTLGLVRVGDEGLGIAMSYRGTGVSPPCRATRLLGRQSQLCPVAALEHWLQVSGIVEGPIFRRIRRGDHVGEERLTSPNVSRLVRRIWSDAAGTAGRSRASGLAPVEGFCFRSLRTGFVISAIESGVSEERIALHLGWSTTAALQTYRRYHQIRRGHPVTVVMAALSATSAPDDYAVLDEIV
ncbi:MAG TPA: tyrosine-type recombinase/integrase [Solirubrobacteraceae bacterium]|nr:tyrosine-type recombinase/integrase [Solirubrobacteraceae bacterium]